MDNRIKDCETLEDLFKLWNDDNHEYFCRDGFVNEKAFDIKERILFVAKESNVSKGTDKDFFWLQSVANGNSDSKVLSRRISIMTNAYFKNEFDDTNKSLDNLKKIAYMNINKRGGTNRTNATKLCEYANNHKDYITREIEIIDPKLIVCCGKLVYEIITDILDPKSNNHKIIEVYHPSYFFISDKKYLERFHNALSDKQLLI